jgi:hypothetical protein
MDVVKRFWAPISVVVGILALVALVFLSLPAKAQTADVYPKLQGEDFSGKPTGTSVTTAAGYDGGAALKFGANVTAPATHPINCSAECDVVLYAQGGQSGGQPSLSVNGSAPQVLTSSTVSPYTFVDVNLPAGSTTLRVTASGTGTGHNAFLDYVTFPASGGSTPPPAAACADGQDNDGDGAVDLNDPGCTDAADNDETNATQPPPSNAPTFPAVDRTVNVTCANLVSTINGDSATTQTDFNLPGSRCDIGSSRLEVGDGDIITGPTGTITNLPVKGTKPNVTAIINANGTTAQVIRPQGSFYMRWVQVQGGDFDGTSGSGVGIAMGPAADDSIIYASRFTGNTGVGISNCHGKFYDVEADNNGSQASLGFISGGIKCIDTAEFIRGYYHDNFGNGVWCDEFCTQNSATLFPNGFWVHDGAYEGNTGGGIRYERATSKALLEDNHIYGNSTGENRGGISIRDAQNAVVEGNIFNGTGYPHNQGADKIAVHASDSGRADRPDLRNITIRNNDLNGEVIRRCGGQVTCTGNFN